MSEVRKPAKPTLTHLPTERKSYQYEVLNLLLNNPPLEPHKVEFVVLKGPRPITKMIALFTEATPESVRHAIESSIRRDEERLDLLSDLQGISYTVEF